MRRFIGNAFVSGNTFVGGKCRRRRHFVGVMRSSARPPSSATPSSRAPSAGQSSLSWVGVPSSVGRFVRREMPSSVECLRGWKRLRRCRRGVVGGNAFVGGNASVGGDPANPIDPAVFERPDPSLISVVQPPNRPETIDASTRTPGHFYVAVIAGKETAASLSEPFPQGHDDQGLLTQPPDRTGRVHCLGRTKDTLTPGQDAHRRRHGAQNKLDTWSHRSVDGAVVSTWELPRQAADHRPDRPGERAKPCVYAEPPRGRHQGS